MEAPTHPPAPPAPDVGDAELLRAFIDARDDLAFGRLVARHAAGLRRIAMLETGNAEAAEDVTQAAFIVLSRRPKPAFRSARRRGSAEAWLHQVARYAAANWRRAEQRRRKREKAVAHPDRTERADPSQPGDLAEAVASALRTLRRGDRRLILLRHVEEKPWSEVAARVGMTPEAARKATERASERLRTALHEQGIFAAPSALAAGLHAIGAPTVAGPPTLVPLSSTAISASELAKGAIVMMNLKSAASVGMLAAALIFGGVGAMTLAQEQPQTSTQRGQAGDEAGVLVARLSDGATVKLKAVGDASGWWRPDGNAAVERTGALLEGQLRMDQRNVELVRKSEGDEAAKAYAEAVRMGFVIEFETPREHLGNLEVLNGSTYSIARQQQSFESDGTLLQFAPGQERVIEVAMPAGEPIARADVQLYALDAQGTKLDGVAVGFTPLGRVPGRGPGGADVTATTVIYAGDLAARTIHPTIVMDDGRELPGELYTHHRVGDVHSLIFTFGPDQIPHPENGRLHLVLMPLEFVRFSNFATGTGQKTTPTIEVLSHEQYRAMLQKRSSGRGRAAEEDGAGPSPQ